MAGGKHILLVDDDATTCAAMGKTLEQAGYRVSCAGNGREALDTLHHGLRPDLILLDLKMDVMNGWQFRQQQVQDLNLAGIPVIIFSAASDVPEEAASLGVADYLRKPAGAEELLEIIRRYC